jgi:hypothetical protein
LGAEKQKLAGHQRGFRGRSHALELGHPEKFQQAEMHKNPDGGREPPSTEKDNNEAKSTGG